MENSRLLIAAMAEQCKQLILQHKQPNSRLPEALQPAHLVWMCEQIEQYAETGSTARLHRWIGFIQCAMMAHEMLDLEGAKAMFDQAKIAHGEPSQDDRDHLDPDSFFEFEIGGEG